MSIGRSHKFDDETPQLLYQKHVSHRVGDLGAPLRDPFLEPDSKTVVMGRTKLVQYGEGFCTDDLTHEELNTLGAYDCPNWTFALMIRRKDQQQVYHDFEYFEYHYKVRKFRTQL